MKTGTNPEGSAPVPMHNKDTNFFNQFDADAEKMNSEAEHSETELSELLKNAEIDLSTELTAPPICLFIDDAAVYYLGDISTTIGKAKGRKTFSGGLTMAALAGNTTIQGRIRGELPPDKRTVLYFDTEQGEYHAQKAAKRVLRLLGVESLPNFKAYGLRKYDPKKRLQAIEFAVYNTPDLGFVCIDGIRDVITSINDEEQATMITSKLLKWSGELNIHINCVLHMNKGDNNARGHVGTELMNKSLTVLGVAKHDKQPEYSIIEPIACRDKEPEPITFGINESGLPYLLEPEQMEILQKLSEAKGKKSLQPSDIQDDTHTDNLRYHIFRNQPEMKYKEIISNIKLVYKIGDNKAGDFLTYFQNKGFVSHIPKGAKSVYRLSL